MKTKYTITDGNAYEHATTLAGAASICEDWYDFLADEGKLESVPSPDLDDSSLDALNSSIGKWEEQIAEALGKKSFAGHGNYYVSAASEAGLQLVVRVESSDVKEIKPKKEQTKMKTESQNQAGERTQKEIQTTLNNGRNLTYRVTSGVSYDNLPGRTYLRVEILLANHWLQNEASWTGNGYEKREYAEGKGSDPLWLALVDLCCENDYEMLRSALAHE